MTAIRLRTVIEKTGPAAAILLDDEQVAALGSAKNPPVVVTVGGRSARLRIARMGGRNMLGLSKAARAELDIEIGDEVDVEIDLDTAKREVEVPEVLAVALTADPTARAAYEALSYTRQKEIARSIAEAKQDATRDRRLEKALADLHG
ncbi:YdeI/OmpD-associated family protein [Microbacterium oryzae]|uniref:YdeI/OmpD-associated family protein n=1 Tax=Microbacterium oryzae TaxID=743009 RepID=UPI0025B1AE55|nr:YdeI/OmpD-associated family protein [Microbacterium oryzae]MDN3311185.1 YdeI/OmpD-associated family protein [Microbacterium oryzae]